MQTDVLAACVRRRVFDDAACFSCGEVVDMVCECSGAKTAKHQAAELPMCRSLGFDDVCAERIDNDGASYDLRVMCTGRRGILMQRVDFCESTKRAWGQSTHEFHACLTDGEI